MPRTRAFTLLEVALIVAIIGMILMMIVGYLFAPKDKGALPPVTETTPIPSSSPIAPTPKPRISVSELPAKTPAPAAPAAVATPAATPAQTIELSPQAIPAFR
jgi:hypothetical protein